MKTNLNYDINLAIELRGKTWLEFAGPEIYTEREAPKATDIIGFRSSILIAQNDGHSEFQASDAEAVAYHCKGANGTNYSGITREEWTKNWRAWRKYMRNTEIPDHSPAGERI